MGDFMREAAATAGVAVIVLLMGFAFIVMVGGGYFVTFAYTESHWLAGLIAAVIAVAWAIEVRATWENLQCL